MIILNFIFLTGGFLNWSFHTSVNHTKAHFENLMQCLDLVNFLEKFSRGFQYEFVIQFILTRNVFSENLQVRWVCMNIWNSWLFNWPIHFVCVLTGMMLPDGFVENRSPTSEIGHEYLERATNIHCIQHPPPLAM